MNTNQHNLNQPTRPSFNEAVAVIGPGEWQVLGWWGHGQTIANYCWCDQAGLNANLRVDLSPALDAMPVAVRDADQFTLIQSRLSAKRQFRLASDAHLPCITNSAFGKNGKIADGLEANAITEKPSATGRTGTRLRRDQQIRLASATTRA